MANSGPIDPSAAGAQHGKREARRPQRPRGVTRLDSATPDAGGTTLKQLMHGSRGRPFANLIDFGVFGVTVLAVALISRAWNDTSVKESPAPLSSPVAQTSGAHSERASSPSGWGAAAPHQAIEPPRPGTGSRNETGTSDHASTTAPVESTAPQLIHKEDGQYTPEARAARFSGRVYVVLTVNEQGMPEQIALTSTAPFGLGERALQAVGRWRYRPATRQGKPVKARIVEEVAFR